MASAVLFLSACGGGGGGSEGAGATPMTQGQGRAMALAGESGDLGGWVRIASEGAISRPPAPRSSVTVRGRTCARIPPRATSWRSAKATCGSWTPPALAGGPGSPGARPSHRGWQPHRAARCHLHPHPGAWRGGLHHPDLLDRWGIPSLQACLRSHQNTRPIGGRRGQGGGNPEIVDGAVSHRRVFRLGYVVPPPTHRRQAAPRILTGHPVVRRGRRKQHHLWSSAFFLPGR